MSLPTTTTTVAGYLLRRLTQAGVRSVFGVPGDDNLTLLDAIADHQEMTWIGTATEQGAGYAADGYARLRGLGAIVTASGAGELSALNAVAGSDAESVPVVHVVGTPALAARRGDRSGDDHLRFARMAAVVTAAQADLRPETAAAEIDRVLSVALRTRRPVYLAIPADVTPAPVPVPGPPLPAPWPVSDTDAAVLSAFAGQARRLRVGAASTAPLAIPASVPVEPLSQASLWAGVQDFLLPGDVVVAGRGTAFYGAAGLSLPAGARLISQPLWASAGWALPATLGASLAAPDRRVVLITGDGALQQTAGELGVLLAQGLAPVIVVLNNAGYAIERTAHRPAAAYHGIPAWDWTTLPSVLAAGSPSVAMRVMSSRQLAAAFRAAGDAGRPVLIDAVLGADDAPPLLQDLARATAAASR